MDVSKKQWLLGLKKKTDSAKMIFEMGRSWKQPAVVREFTIRLVIWMFPKIWAPQKEWFIMENRIRMDDFGVPLFLETLIW